MTADSPALLFYCQTVAGPQAALTQTARTVLLRWQIGAAH